MKRRASHVYMNTRRLLLAALLLCASPALAKTVSVTGVALDQSGGTSPTVQKLSFAAGETSEIDIAVTHPDGTPYNLSGTGMTLAVNGQVISRPATIINAAAGTAKFPLVIADTLNLLGVYTYDITLTATDGSFYRVVPASSFVVTAGIGQPGQPVTVPATQQPLAQGPPGNPQNIENNGSALTSRSTINFAGAGISCADNPGAGRTDCTVNSGGTVTSVAMSMPAQFSVSGSPITGSGTLAASWANETANTVMCGPASGSAAAPTFRALVAADIPALPESQITNLVSDLASKGSVSSVAMSVPSWLSVSGSPVTTTGTLAVSAAGAQTQNEVLATPNGVSGAVGLRSLVDGDMPAHAAVCTPTTVGDYCGWSGTAWVREPAPGGGGGTQGGTTTASHVPYASGANTLSDGELSFTSATHTYSAGTSTAFDYSSSSGVFKTPTGITTISGGILNSGITFWDIRVNGTSKIYADANQFSPQNDGVYVLGGANLRWSVSYVGSVSAPPACDAGHRGGTTTVFSGTGVGDIFEVCMKGTADTYAWRTVFTAP